MFMGGCTKIEVPKQTLQHSVWVQSTGQKQLDFQFDNVVFVKLANNPQWMRCYYSYVSENLAISEDASFTPVSTNAYSVNWLDANSFETVDRQGVTELYNRQ